MSRISSVQRVRLYWLSSSDKHGPLNNSAWYIQNGNNTSSLEIGSVIISILPSAVVSYQILPIVQVPAGGWTRARTPGLSRVVFVKSFHRKGKRTECYTSLRLVTAALKPLMGEEGPRCRGKSRQSQGRMCSDVHARAGDLPLHPVKVQLPPCLAAHEEAAVATTSQPLSVVQAFSGSTVLVTGGTGYLGSLVGC